MADSALATDQASPTASAGGDLVQVGNTQMTPEMFQTRTVEIRSDYADAIDDVNKKFFDLAANIAEIQAGISNQLSTASGVTASAYNNMVSDMHKQITNIQHAQNMQVSQAASQLDSMLSTGQFGGNVYRSQQVYAMNLTTVIGNSMQVVADVTLEYRKAAEVMRVEASQLQLSSYIEGASTVLVAMTDLAKTYALVRSDLTINKNAQLNEIFTLRVQQDIANKDRAAQVSIARMQQEIAKMQIDANKLMTQWQLDASMNETLLNIQLQDRKIEADKYMADRNNQVKINLAQMEINFQSEQNKLNRELQTYLTEVEINSREYLSTRQQDMEYELGLIQLDHAREARREQMEHEIKLETDRLNQQYQLTAKQADMQMSQFNQQMNLTRQQYSDSVSNQAAEARQMADFQAQLDAEGAAFAAQNRAMQDKMEQWLTNAAGGKSTPTTEQTEPAARLAVEPQGSQAGEVVYTINGEQKTLTFNEGLGTYSLPEE